ncbi:hypothetical protein B0E43_18040 [Algoriphagus sp. A40]|nr:hypothetical protein B0E43_18040 [Algoriphagus sp. A40]
MLEQRRCLIVQAISRKNFYSIFHAADRLSKKYSGKLSLFRLFKEAEGMKSIRNLGKEFKMQIRLLYVWLDFWRNFG